MLKAIAIFDNSGAGTVTSVSVATANGFAGTVANPSTTPTITVKTTVSGLVKGNGTALSAAVGDVDYQNPITLTTTGTSGAATFTGDVLNIPQYAGTTYSAGTGLTLTGSTFSITNTAVLATSYGSSTSIPSFTVNAQGQLTAAAGNVVVAPASTLTGTTLASNVVTSSLTTVGTLVNLTVTNAISGSITGNAATVTTNANLTGDVTSVGNATTLATVNSNTGSFGSSTAIPNFTVNGKGLITAAGTNAVVAPASTLTGTTLASNVVTSSLTTVGTLTNLTVTNAPTFTALNTAGVVQNSAGGVLSTSANPQKRDITFTIDGQGSVIAAGGTWYLSNIPYAGTITAWAIVADVSGSVVIDVWKANAAVPTVANTITASALPTLTSAQSAFGGSIAGWTTAIAAGDVFAFHVNSATTLTKVSLTIQVTTT